MFLAGNPYPAEEPFMEPKHTYEKKVKYIPIKSQIIPRFTSSDSSLPYRHLTTIKLEEIFGTTKVETLHNSKSWPMSNLRSSTVRSPQIQLQLFNIESLYQRTLMKTEEDKQN